MGKSECQSQHRRATVHLTNLEAHILEGQLGSNDSGLIATPIFLARLAPVFSRGL